MAEPCKHCGACDHCDRCAHCGHCRNCGRYVMIPYVPYWPYTPYVGPIWITTTTPGTGTTWMGGYAGDSPITVSTTPASTFGGISGTFTGSAGSSSFNC